MQILLHKRSLYSFAFTLVYLLFVGAALGQTNKTWIGVNGNNWETEANWSPSGVPTINDIVTIGNHDVIINSAASCASLTYGGGSSTATLTISGSNSLNVTGQVTILAPTGQKKTKTIAVGNGSLFCSSIKMTNGGNGSRDCQLLIFTGTVTVSGNIVMEGTESRNYILFSGAGTLNIGGNITGGELATAANSTVNYNGAAQTIYPTPYHNLILSGSGSKTMIDIATINGNFTIAGSASAVPTITDTRLLNTMNVMGSVTFEAGTTFDAGTINLSIGGNWINNGTRFIPSTSKVIFNGSNPQSIGGSVPTTFYNLTIDNRSPISTTTNQVPRVSLAQSENVSGTLTLMNGLLVIPATESQTSLVLNNSIAISDGGTPFNSGKHIVTQVGEVAQADGSKKVVVGVLKVKNIGNSQTSYTLPVGDGFYFMPATVKPVTSSDFDVTVFRGVTADGQPFGTSLSQELKSIMIDAVWDISGTPSVPTDISLSWPQDQELKGGNVSYGAGSSFGITHNINGQWDPSSGTYDPNTNTVTRPGVTSFSPFAVSWMAMSVLPVHFSHVRASEKSSGVQVEFTNATESDVDYYEVERSSDGKLFSPIKKLNPLKNNYGSVAYSWVDATAKEGRNIYRIKAVETGGKTVYSSLISITLGSRNSGLSVYAKGGQVALQVSSLPAGKYQLQLFNAGGQLLGLENINHGGGAISQTTSLNSAKAGIYILNISGAVRMQQKFLVQ